MKDRVARILLSQEFQMSVLGRWLRHFVRASQGSIGYSPYFRLDTQAIDRPHYAYCMLKAAELSKALSIDRFSVIEFGVAGGNGLKFMTDFAKEVEGTTGVAVDCYGFDSGAGMPPPVDDRDLPYWFQEAQYAMDEDALRIAVPSAKLIIGPVRDTITTFLEAHQPSPIGAMFFDMDYYSSTMESFAVFDGWQERSQYFLPRLFMYFDDIIGSEHEMYGPFNGQLSAIDNFNRPEFGVKIHLNQNLINKPHLTYARQIYYAHLFGHPRYQEFTGAARQQVLEERLKLK